MRYVKINDLKQGDVLARDITDINGNILLRANNTVLSEFLISKLRERKIGGIYITDDLSKNLEIEEEIPLHVKYMAIDALEKKEVQQTEELSKQIVETFKFYEIDLNRMLGETTYYERALNICELCLNIGKRLNMTNNDLIKLVASALLSDIGLILTEKEKEEILDSELENLRKILLNLPISETYPILSKYVVSKAYADPIIIHSVYYHSENENGTGVVQDFYKKFGIDHNCDIRKTAKIIHVCSDYVDTLLKENDFIKARYKIEKGIIDGLYNYEIAAIFLKFVPIYPIGTIVKLSNGEEAIVIKNNEGYPLTPIVKTKTEKVIDLTKILNIVIENDQKREKHL